MMSLDDCSILHHAFRPDQNSSKQNANYLRVKVVSAAKVRLQHLQLPERSVGCNVGKGDDDVPVRQQEPASNGTISTTARTAPNFRIRPKQQYPAMYCLR